MNFITTPLRNIRQYYSRLLPHSNNNHMEFLYYCCTMAIHLLSIESMNEPFYNKSHTLWTKSMKKYTQGSIIAKNYIGMNFDLEHSCQSDKYR